MVPIATDVTVAAKHAAVDVTLAAKEAAADAAAAIVEPAVAAHSMEPAVASVAANRHVGSHPRLAGSHPIRPNATSWQNGSCVWAKMATNV